MTSPPPTTTKTWCHAPGGYPSGLHLATLPFPATPPSPHHLIIRTAACALNPVDIQLMNLPLWSLPIPPFNGPHKQLGEDFAGTVIAVGKALAGEYDVGDEVMGIGVTMNGSTGALSEMVAVNVGEGKGVVVKCGEARRRWGSWAKCAGVPLVWLTARTCVEAVRGSVEGGAKKVVVLGASSSTGMYCVLQAKRRGWDVLGTCSGRNAEFAKSMGAGQVVDYTKESVAAKVKAFAPDAIIDCVGGTECLNLCKRYVTIVGDKTTRTSMGGAAIYLWNPQMLLRWALGKVGWGVWYDCVNLGLKKEWLEEALELGKEEVVVDSEWEFERGKEAFERLNTGRARGKVVLNVD